MTSPLKHSAALLCMGAVLSIALVEPAVAQTANIEGVLQNIVTMLTGNVARLLATLAVIIVGFAQGCLCRPRRRHHVRRLRGGLDLDRRSLMIEAARLTEDTLFLACTRPAMIAGVTMEAMALNVMFSCILFLAAGSIIYGLVAIPIHGLCRVICRHDPNMFRILLAWIETRGRTRNAAFWGGSSCTPLKLVRRYRTRDLGYA